MTGEWADFNTTVATIAAALLGLNFVALQIGGAWKTKDLGRAAAVTTLTEFLVVLMTTLIPILPTVSWRIGSVISGAFGLIEAFSAIGWVVFKWIKGKAKRDLYRWAIRDAWLTSISVAVYASLVVAGALNAHLAAGAILLWLLFSGTLEVINIVLSDLPRE